MLCAVNLLCNLLCTLYFVLCTCSCRGDDFAEGRGGRPGADDIHPSLNAFGDLQRRPASLVRLIPDLDLRALLGEEMHDGGHVLVRRAVHDGLTILVDRV